MNPILFSIGSVHIYSYGLMMVIALIAGYLFFNYLNKKEEISDKLLLDKFCWIFIGGVVFSRISYFIIYHDQFTAWWQIFQLWRGGLISFTGIIGGFVTYLVVFGKNSVRNLDKMGLVFLLATFLWRLGCTLAGDHPTLSSSSYLAINRVLPVPLWESLLALIGFWGFYKLYQTKKNRNGKIFIYIIIYYGIIRVVIDYWRIDSKILDYNIGQWSGLFLVIIGLVMLFLIMKHDKSKIR